MTSTPDESSVTESDDVTLQPLRDGDSSMTADPADDPAQAEWDATIAVDEGLRPVDLDETTATGADPAELPADDDQVPAADLPGDEFQPESQGDDPVLVELGDDGQGDLAPEDL